jgi:transcriptional regulator with XRE-family HTH domain
VDSNALLRDVLCAIMDIVCQDSFWPQIMETKLAFGETIRALREQRAQPLRVVAAALEIDSTLLSKIERRERFPTPAQVVKLARYFGVPLEELAALVIADKIVHHYGYEAATLRAIRIVEERTSSHLKMRR